MSNRTRGIALIWMGGFLIGVGVGIILGTAMAKADDLTPVQYSQAEPTVLRVIDLLKPLGIKAVQPKPIILMADLRKIHAMGASTGNFIFIDTGAPFGCFERIVSHEMTHIILRRDLHMTPESSEPFALAMERIIDPEFKPGCESHKE